MDMGKTDIVQFDSKENRRGTSFRASLSKRRPSRTGTGKSEKEKTNNVTPSTIPKQGISQSAVTLHGVAVFCFPQRYASLDSLLYSSVSMMLPVAS